MADDIPTSGAIGDDLGSKVTESRKRFEQDPTPENRTAHQRAVKAFADFVLRGRLPDDPDSEATGGSAANK